MVHTPGRTLKSSLTEAPEFYIHVESAAVKTSVDDVIFCDPDTFVAGEVHSTL